MSKLSKSIKKYINVDLKMQGPGSCPVFGCHQLHILAKNKNWQPKQNKIQEVIYL